jgi:class 3 adenylate cyclase
MTFDEILAQVLELLQQEKRVSYRGLKRRFALDDDYLEDLKEELRFSHPEVTDEDGRGLVWIDASRVSGSTFQVPRYQDESQKAESRNVPLLSQDSALRTQHSTGERRQLTVLFCDLVGSTALSEQLDPEEYREVVQGYQETCAEVIRRYDGHLAQHLGDGLLVYFGYPVAHEDDAQRAVRTGLEIVAALQSRARQPAVNRPLPHGRGSDSLPVRIGIHTGLVVIGEIGSSEKREILALGETPNLAARLQGLAAPDTVVISTATHRLVQGFFTLRSLGSPTLKGISTAMEIYQVLGESGRQSRFEVAVGRGLTPLVGREEELGLLQRRWEQAKSGEGQVVLLSGEAGIGKSRLVQILKEQVASEMAVRVEYRCSPYHQNSAFYPVIDHFQRLLQLTRDDSPEEKVRKLAAVVAGGALQDGPRRAEAVALVAALLSLPLPTHYPPLMLTPQRQKQKTLEALLAWLMQEAGRQPVLVVVEDMHWVDPSTLEFLSLLLEQVPTTRILLLLTFRPDFTPPWAMFSHLTQLTLSRLARKQVEVMVEKVTGGKALPAEVIQQLITKTDGVPLFVEELTKMVVESGLLRATDGHYELSGPLPPLAIPATL